MLSKSEKIDPRITRTRQLILQAFIEFIGKKSFQSLTVQDITESAGINRATFYAHFADKYALYEFAVGEWFQSQLENAVKLEEGLSHENLARLISFTFQFLQGTNNQCHPADKQYKPMLEAKVQEKLYELLLDWIESSSDKPELEAHALSWMLFGMALSWAKGEIRLSPEELKQETLSFLETQLGTKLGA